MIGLQPMRKLAAIGFIFLAAIVTSAQTNPREKKETTYWLKYSLIFFTGCQPTVSADNITFTRGSCSTNPYAGDILPRGTEVRVTSVSRTKPYAVVSFKRGAHDYEVALENGRKDDFRKAFDLLFTTKRLSEFYETKCPNKVETKRDVIACLGFPITITRDGDVELYFYILEFVGPGSIGGGFDGFNVKIKRNRFIDITGYI